MGACGHWNDLSHVFACKNFSNWLRSTSIRLPSFDHLIPDVGLLTRSHSFSGNSWRLCLLAMVVEYEHEDDDDDNNNKKCLCFLMIQLTRVDGGDYSL